MHRKSHLPETGCEHISGKWDLGNGKPFAPKRQSWQVGLASGQNEFWQVGEGCFSTSSYFFLLLPLLLLLLLLLPGWALSASEAALLGLMLCLCRGRGRRNFGGNGFLDKN